MEYLQGAHQVAQKSTTVTFPCGSAVLPPPSKGNATAGAALPDRRGPERLPWMTASAITLAVAAATKAQIHRSLRRVRFSDSSAIGRVPSGRERPPSSGRKIGALCGGMSDRKSVV